MVASIAQLGQAIGDKLRDYLLPYQWAWLTDRSRYKLAEKARRTGWTYVEALSAVIERLTGRDDYWFSSADESAAEEFIEYCRFWADFLGQAAAIVDDKPKVEKRVTRYQITLANGRRISAMSSNPKRFRSKGGSVCWDEAAWHDEPKKMWAALKPVIQWGGTLRVFSTHNGEENYFNGLVKDGRGVSTGAKDPRRDGVLPWSFHSVTVLDAVAQGLVEKIDGTTVVDERRREEWLAEERAGARDEDTWQQEYMCKPSSESKALLPYDLIRECSRPEEDLLGHYGSGSLYAGYDVGRERDLSYWPVGEDVAGVLFVRHHEWFKGTPYRDQRQAVIDYWRQRRIRRMCGDATGIGDNLIEDLGFEFGRHRVEKVKFTAEVKEDLAMGLVERCQDHRLWLPDVREVREGLHKVRKTVTSAGNVRYDAAHDKDGHADEFWGTSLMCMAAGRRGRSSRCYASVGGS